MNGMKRPACRVAAIVLGVWLAAFAVAVGHDRAQAQATLHGLTFPQRIAGTEIAGTHSFEDKNPGLGYSVEYRLAGWKIDVYIYDLRQTSIPDDAMSDAVKGQLRQATQDIFKAGYGNVAPRLKYAILDDGTKVRFLCQSFGYTHKSLGKVDSYLCVTAFNRKFVKFRMTTGVRAGSESVANRFVQAWTKVLWP